MGKCFDARLIFSRQLFFSFFFFSFARYLTCSPFDPSPVCIHPHTHNVTLFGVLSMADRRLHSAACSAALLLWVLPFSADDSLLCVIMWKTNKRFLSSTRSHTHTQIMINKLLSAYSRRTERERAGLKKNKKKKQEDEESKIKNKRMKKKMFPCCAWVWWNPRAKIYPKNRRQNIRKLRKNWFGSCFLASVVFCVYYPADRESVCVGTR